MRRNKLQDLFGLSEDDDLRAWYRLSPLLRFLQTERLWRTFVLLGGTSDPAPDPQSPFYFPPEKRAGARHGGPGVRPLGGAEFSRDIDFAVAVEPANLDRLRRALSDLGAVPIFFPPLSREALARTLEAGAVSPALGGGGAGGPLDS